MLLYHSQAMDEFQRVEDARLQCFKKCSREEIRYPSHRDSMTQDQVFYFTVIQRKHCIRRCEEDIVGLLPIGGVASQVVKQLKRKDGYNYLQVAYYRVSSGEPGRVEGKIRG